MEITIIRRDGTTRELHGNQVEWQQTDEGTFFLSINDVEEADAGTYTASCAPIARVLVSE